MALKFYTQDEYAKKNEASQKGASSSSKAGKLKFYTADEYKAFKSGSDAIAQDNNKNPIEVKRNKFTLQDLTKTALPIPQTDKRNRFTIEPINSKHISTEAKKPSEFDNLKSTVGNSVNQLVDGVKGIIKHPSVLTKSQIPAFKEAANSFINPTDEQKNQYIESLKTNPIASFILNAGNAATLGLNNRYISSVGGKKVIEEMNKNNSKSALAGEIVGSIAPWSAAEGALKFGGKQLLKTELGTLLKESLPSIASDKGGKLLIGAAKGALKLEKGAAAGAIVAGTQAAIEGNKNVAASALEGSKMGLGGEAAGMVLGKVAKAIASKLKNKVPLTVAEVQIVKANPNEFKGIVETQIPKDDVIYQPEVKRAQIGSKSTEEIKLGEATWKNKDFDQPVKVVQDMGVGPDGRRYVKVEGSNSAVPYDEIRYADGLKPKLKLGKLQPKTVDVPIENTVNKVSTLKDKKIEGYHGTKNAGFEEFNTKNPVWFSKKSEMADAYTGKDGQIDNSRVVKEGDNPGTYKSILDIKNPFVLDRDITEFPTYKEASKTLGIRPGTLLGVKKENIIKVSTQKEIKGIETTLNEQGVLVDNGKYFDKTNGEQFYNHEGDIFSGTYKEGKIPNKIQEDLIKKYEDAINSKGKRIQQINSYKNSINEDNMVKPLYATVNSPEYKKILQDKGYDGIIATDQGEKTYAVFNNSQIENAIGKNRNIPSTTIQKATIQKVVPREFTGKLPINKTKNVAENIDNSLGIKSEGGLNLQQFSGDNEVKSGISEFGSNTLSRAIDIPDDVKAIIKPNEFDYIKETSKEWADDAAKNIAADRNKVVNDIYQAKSISGGTQAHEAALISHELLQDAQKTGSYAKYKAFLKVVAEKTRESARALKGTDTAWEKKTADGAIMDAQRVVDGVEEGLKKTNPNKIKSIDTQTDKIVKDIKDMTDAQKEARLKQIFKEVPKKKQRTLFEKVQELIELGAYDKESIRDLIKKKEGLPILENSDIKQISEYMDKAKEFKDGSYDQRMWMTKAQQIIADKVPATKYEKFRGLQRISLILNPKSLLTRNPLGNAILGAGETIKDVPGALIDHLVSLGTGERTTALNPLNKLKGQAEGFTKGIKEFGKDIKNNVDTSPTRGQLELPSKRVFDNGVLNAIDQFERKALQLGDRPFYQSAYNGRIAELKGLGKTIDEATEAEAKLYALDRVFQNNSVLSKKARQLKESLGPIGDIVLPFTQTPANVMDKLIDYTPGGFVKAITQLGDIGKGTFNQKLFVDRLGRTLTGAGIGILGYVMAEKGMIVGQSNADKDVAAFEKGLGKNPYAVKIGNHYYTFDWAQPIAGLLAAGADAYKAGKDKKDFISSIGAGATAAGNTLLQQSFLQGVLSLMSGYSPVAGLTKAVLGAPLQAAPTMTSNIAKQIDPYVRETYDPNPIKQAANKFVAKVPLASKTLPKKVDAMGQDIKQQQGVGSVQKAFNLFINPSNSTTFKPNETEKEILRLFNEGGTKVQVPTVVEKYIAETKDHPRINLTPEEFIQYQKRTGQLTIKGSDNPLKPLRGFEEVMNSERYKKAKSNKEQTVDEVRAEMLAKVIEKAKARAKAEIVKARGY